MMRAAAVLAWCLGAAAACGGDVLYVDVRAAEGIGCQETRALQPLTAVEVDVLREVRDGLEVMANQGSCESVGPTNQVADLLAPFEAAGLYVEGVPAGSRTILRFFGYTGRAACARGNEIVCGITCPPIREGEIPADGVEARFVCDSIEAHQVFLGCSNLEGLTEEARAGMCDLR